MKQVLIVDDDHGVRRTLELHFTHEGFAVDAAADGTEGVRKALDGSPDLVLLDIRLPGLDGFEVLRTLHRDRPGLPVIVITAYDDMQTAIEAIKLGAVDHLGKPLDLAQLDEVVAKVLEMATLSERGYAFVESLDPPAGPHAIVGRSRAMKGVYKAIGAVANSRATVLIHGESGTGKELVARAIHFNSPYANRPFLPVACSALAPSLLESELFGHEKGAFTGADRTKPGKFELAQGGTLFLDEISEVDPAIQVKLLRFLQEREFERVGGIETLRSDVRVVAATNRDLTEMVREGAFRRDLYYRLKVVTIELPPLRERTEDIPLLVQYLLDKIGAEVGKRIEVVPEEVIARFRTHPWPGNVRELENALRRAVLLSPGGVLVPETLQLEGDGQTGRLPLLLRSVQELEKEHIENILRYTGYQKKRAAEILNLSRPTLDKRIRDYGIRIPS